MEFKYLDLSYIKHHISDDPTFLRQLLEIFRASNLNDMAALETALQKEDHEMIKRSAHKVKSSFRSLGVDSLRDLLQEIETKADEKVSVDELRALYAQVDEVYPMVESEIDEFLDA